MDKLTDHPLAELFPLMPEQDLKDLANDIQTSGLKAPITIHEGMILDGRNRYRACAVAGVEPRTRQFPQGEDALAFVLSVNLHRRHLTESQRAMVAAKIARLPRGRTEKIKEANLPICPTIAEAAQRLAVSPRLVRQARAVLASGTETKAVEKGAKTVNAAAKEVKAAKAAKAARATKTANEVHRDATGYAIPEEILALWQRKPEVDQLLKLVSQARVAAKSAHEQDDILFAPSNLNSVIGKLNEAYSILSNSVPFAVCPTCQGYGRTQCLSCKGRGIVGKFFYDTCVPAELKAVRNSACVQ
ncbi:hypothetical protein CfE428DRAFT_3201 [Chthoniobacter flavus Ellin428]|uniref:Uncharacterized protein n=1 Tax=Chthoniobacter flavus Ellin428 TaxID=497964 RepID=B4D2R3_9BACT|nr:ParB N-terminal domain-containing protein [Chthoniobacter flavus]EDY19024.1 hypothetical protein CfE428DRAFT_3201 [Chthoniobacter flavus Ellin428]TCO86788.1 ParB-like chromosome segregation protein Spo0J [Chthoniobacter flavus]